jgi:crotonobetainyl-CoA:carnitine CoA-transferase CaiB-like acyl-CoA transferase
VGADTDAVLAESDAGVRAGARAAVASPPPPGAPLAGITVIEFATIIAAPLSTSMLADLGARVVRVEAKDGDPYRHLVAGGTTAAKTTAGKESICLDLKSSEGRELARALVRRADVVVHNYRPGVAERLGLGEAELRAEQPSLVYVSVAGYGRHSPSARRPATHPCAGAAAGGAAHQAGPALRRDCADLAEVREVARQLIRANESNPDPNTSAVAAAATLLALLARERHGTGQSVHVNMLAANLYANADDALAYAGKPPRLEPDADLLGLHARYRLYPTADGWLFLAAPAEADWDRLVTALGRPSWAGDPRFATASARRAHDDELATAVAATLGERTAAEWECTFVAAGLAGVRADAATPGRAFAHDPVFLDNGFTPECTHRRFGTHRRWGPVVRVDGGLTAYGPGVLAGEHTDAVLTELGCSPARITELRAAGVVGSEAVAWAS